MKELPKRWIVVGTSCNGKSTLAKKLAPILGYPLCDLDDLYWVPNWGKRNEDEFLGLVQDFADQDEWMIVGNYRVTRPITWPRAQVLLWLDLPFLQVLWRCVKRTFRHWRTGANFCNGNRESLSRIFSRESMIWWVLTTTRRRRRAYAEIWKKQEEYPFEMIRLRSQKEVDQYFENFKKILN